jgi:hypothetical protein
MCIRDSTDTIRTTIVARATCGNPACPCPEHAHATVYEHVTIEPRRRPGFATLVSLALAGGFAPPPPRLLSRRGGVPTTEDLARIERARAKRERKAAQKAGDR